LLTSINAVARGFANAAGRINDFFNPDLNSQIDSLSQEIFQLEGKILSLTKDPPTGFFDKLFGDDVRNLSIYEQKVAQLRAERQKLIDQGKQKDGFGDNLNKNKQTVGVFTAELQKLKFTSDQIQGSISSFGGVLNTTKEEAFIPVLNSIKALGFSTKELQTLLQDQAFVESVVAGNQEINTSFSGFTESFKAQAKTIKVTNAQIAKSFITSLSNGVGNAFAGFGAALASGQNAFKAFGDVIKKLFGDLLVQLGQGFILQGTARLLAGDPGGPALIAAGAALATFGGFIGGAGGGTGGGGAAQPVAGGAPAFGPENRQFEEQGQIQPNTAVNINIQGDVFDSDETGSRITNILNDAFDKQGVVVSNRARFA
jgi:hypothetical protein